MLRSSWVGWALVVTTVAAALVVAPPARADEPRDPASATLKLSPTLRDLLRLLDAPMQIVVPARFEDKHLRPPPSGAPEDWFLRPRGWFGAMALRF
jgi:hypothetical protein